MKTPDVFTKMTGLKKLDISEHPEFLMTPEMRELVEYKAKQGL